MPYLRNDLDKLPEEVFWFMKMGPVVVNADVHPTRVSSSELLDHEGGLGAGERTEQNGATRDGMTSRPPSPPDSRPATPKLTIMPCPVRLTPLVPPENYGAVERGTIFRSGFPQSASVDFLETLKIQSMLTLVVHEPKPEVGKFLAMFGIKHAQVAIEKNKNGTNTTLDSLCEALLFIMNPANHPVYIHCNMGKHRTGCVVACLRKCQQWPIEEALAEYHTYAADKARPADVEVIKAFDPASVYEYAKLHDYLDSWQYERRQDSATDIWELASSLPAHDLSYLRHARSDSDDEDVIMMKDSAIDPMLLADDSTSAFKSACSKCRSCRNENISNGTAMDMQSMSTPPIAVTASAAQLL